MTKQLKILVGLVVIVGVAVAAVNLGYVSIPDFLGATPSVPKRIGIIVPAPVIAAYKDGFVEGMKELGYDEGKNVIYDIREAGGDAQKIAQAVQELTSANDIDLIFALTDSAARSKEALEKAGKQTPVVFVGVEDPVVAKLVASYQSSGNNVTGIVGGLAAVTAKKLEFLKELAPQTSRLGVFSLDFVNRQPGPPVYASLLKEAPSLGFQIVRFDRTKKDTPITIEETQEVADSIRSGTIDAIFHIPGHTLTEQEFIEPAAAIRLKVPNIGGIPIEVERGALFSYSPDFKDVGKQAAIMADKIFKGTSPSDIPIEQPRKYLLAFNLATAKAIGITIPQHLTAITDIRYDK